MTKTKHSIRIRRYDWFDKVALWRGRAPQQRQAIGQAGHTRYYFGVRRFVHCITADTLCQMQYAPADTLARQELARLEYNESAT